jgi:hypothetical protein
LVVGLCFHILRRVLDGINSFHTDMGVENYIIDQSDWLAIFASSWGYPCHGMHRPCRTCSRELCASQAGDIRGTT